MDKNQGLLTKVKQWLSKEGGSGKKSGKYQYMVLALCIGAAFMLAGNVLLKKPTGASDTPAVKMEPSTSDDVPAFGATKSSSSSKAMNDYERQYETQLKEALDAMLGVEDVKVVVNIDSSEERILQKNQVTKNQTTNETDPNGGKRTVQDASIDEQMVIVRNGEQEVPIVVETKKPQIRGVLVVAKGAENIQVKKWIVEAVTRALGVPSHRVAVMPKK